MSTVPWRLAKSLDVLRRETNQRWPGRSKVSDGTLGNAEHAARPSDHNRNAVGVVRAIDITAAGIDAAWLAEHIRVLGSHGFAPLVAGGYVIFNRRTASERSSWQWRTYTGPNPHISHLHVSCSRDAARYDSTSPWRITDQKDDLMPALTDAEQREILRAVRTAAEKATNAALLAASVDQRCERLERSIHGVDNESKGRSLFIKMTYLAAETIDGVKGPMLDRTLRKFGAE